MNLRLSFVLLALALSLSAQAHHSAAVNYDTSKTIELKGKVVEFKMRSPHSLVVLEVPNKQGQPERWSIETHALPTLRRAGWDHDTLKPGDELKVNAFPNRKGTVRVVNAREFIRPDGTVLGGAAKIDQAKGDEGSNSPLGPIAGRWKPDMFAIANYHEREPLVTLTPAARKVWSAYDVSQSPAKSCTPNNIPDIFYPPYLYDIQVVGQNVVLKHEVFNITRTVPMSGEFKQAEKTGQFGNARAKIDNGQLIVESNRYTPNPWGLGMAATPIAGAGDVPASAQKKVVERYSVDPTGQVLTVEYTLEDPVNLAKPYTGKQTWKRVPNTTPMYPFDCAKDSATLYDQKK